MTPAPENALPRPAGLPPLHLCLLCNEYPPAPHGGIGSFTLDLAEGLAQAGQAVTVVGVQGDASANTDDFGHGVRVCRTGAVRWRRPWRAVLLADRLRLRRRVAQLHRESPFSLVEVPDYGGWLPWGAPAGLPLVARLHGANLLYDHELQQPGVPFEHRLERATLRRATAWLAVSRYAAARTATLCGRRPARVDVLPNAVDAELFCPDPAVAVEPGLILFVNSIGPRKGVAQLIAAMPAVLQACPQARLLLLGGEAHRPADGRGYAAQLLESVPPAVRARITFAGAMDRHTGVLAALRQAQVCCFPSLCETFGIAPLEAMAVGKPVIYSRLGPGPEIIADGQSGVLCDPRHPEEIAACLCRVLTDAEFATHLGAAARQRVREHFDRRDWVARNLRAYGELVAAAAGTAAR